MTERSLSPKELAGFLILFAWGVALDTVMVATDILRWFRRKIA